MNDKLNVTFWGVRGSYPVSGAQAVRYGGNTACVAVQAGELTVILDAGTGIIGLGRELIRRARGNGQALRSAIFFSHLHHDHTQGFPFFAPAYVPGAQIQIFGPDLHDQGIEDVLRGVVAPPVFPVRLSQLQAELTFQTLGEGQVVWLSPNSETQVFTKATCPPAALRPASTVEVRLLLSYAHPGGVMLYRINWGERSVVYATDTEGYVSGDRRLAAFARGVDLLIHDAQYTEAHYCGLQAGLPATQGWGHSTIQIACELAATAEVKQLALFHHDPGYDDERVAANEALARSLFTNSLAAREGLQWEDGQVIGYPVDASSVQYRYRKPTGQLPATPFGTGRS